MRLNLPNALTLFRIFLVPVLVVLLLTPPLSWSQGWADSFDRLRSSLALAVFLLAAATDWLDGYLARSRNQVTTLGKLLDPIADKLLTVSAFVSLVELGSAPAWMVVLIIGREFAVSGMRSIAAARGVVMAASSWGKIKTASQVVAISLLILQDEIALFKPSIHPGHLALWVVLVLAIVSMVDYFVQFWRKVDLDAAD